MQLKNLALASFSNVSSGLGILYESLMVQLLVILNQYKSSILNPSLGLVKC